VVPCRPRNLSTFFTAFGVQVVHAGGPLSFGLVEEGSSRVCMHTCTVLVVRLALVE
jgi:hypothetical protein